MSRHTYMKVNFNGGILSPLMDGRIDFPKYTSGAKEMENFVPLVYGPMTKRPGTRFVENLGSEAALYPFEFSEQQAYIFAFKEGSIDVYTRDGRLLDGNSQPVTLPSIYTLDQARELRFAQTGDLMYFTHPIRGMQKISRTGVNTFTSEQFEPINGPFQDENPDEALTIKLARLENNPDGTVKRVQIEASQQIYRLSDVGSLVKVGYIPSTEFDTWTPDQGSWAVGNFLQYEGRVYQVTAGTGKAGTRSPLHEKGSKSDGLLTLKYISNGYGYAKITGVGAEPSATAFADVIKQFPPNLVPDTIDSPPSFGRETDEWSWGAFGGRFGWPKAIVFHEQRMVLGGSLEQPQTIWGSTVTDIQDFDEGTADDQSYEFTIASNKKDSIEWLTSYVTLNIGTGSSEFVADSSGASITPTDISISKIGEYGSRSTQAITANGFTVFVQQGGLKLRELRYEEESQRNYARDLNKVAENVTAAGITSVVYQAEPYQVIWNIIGNELYAFTYETDEDVYAWSKQSVGEVHSIATVPNNGLDRLWMVVRRNGNWYIEYLTEFYKRNDSQEDATFSDSSLVYEGQSTTTISGLNHLEGREVSILGNGATQPNRTVQNGSITLQTAVTKAVIGLPYKAIWNSMRLEGGSNDGVGQGKSKCAKQVVFRIEDLGSTLFYGPASNGSFNSMDSFIASRNTLDRMDVAPPLFNGDTNWMPVQGDNSKEYQFRVEHDRPLPCTIIAIILDVETHER